MIQPSQNKPKVQGELNRLKVSKKTAVFLARMGGEIGEKSLSTQQEEMGKMSMSDTEYT